MMQFMKIMSLGLMLVLSCMLLTGCQSTKKYADMIVNRDSMHLKAKENKNVIIPVELRSNRITDAYAIPPVAEEAKEVPSLSPPSFPEEMQKPKKKPMLKPIFQR